jgi:hypothetical protein
MRDTAFVFFAAATVCVFVGMFWGIQMSVSHDHSLASAHAHLNLVGWATMALFGIYYRLTPAANNTLLAKIQAGVAILGVAVMVPGIAIVIQGGTPAIAAAGSFLSVTSMAIFLYTVMRHGFGARS